MFRRFRRLFIYFISVLILLLCLVAGLSIIFKDKVTALFLIELNKRLQTEIKVKNVNFSIVKKFPYASIEFNQIYAKISSNYVQNDVVSSSDTLFFFSSLFLEFSIYDLITGDYKISKIHAIKGTLNIARDKFGNFNYLILKNSLNTDTAKFSLKLQNVKLNEIKISYSDFMDPKHLGAILKDCAIKCSLSKLKNEFSSRFKLRNVNFQYDSLQFRVDKDAIGSVNFKIIGNKVLFENTSLTLLDNQYTLYGIYDPKLSPESIFTIKCDNFNIENALLLLPEKIKTLFTKFNIKGNLSLSASFINSKLKSPIIDAKFKSIKSSFSFNYDEIEFSNFFFNGSYYSNLSDTTRINKIVISNLSGKIDSDPFEGTITFLKGRSNKFDIKWHGSSSFQTLNKLILNDTLKQLSGYFNGHMEIKGDVKNKVSVSKFDFAQFKYFGEINLGSIKILKPELLLGISEMSGKLLIDKNVIINNSNIIYKGNHLTGSGEIENFLPWLLTANETLIIKADLQSQLFNLDNVFSNNINLKSDTSITHFPDYLILELNIKFKEFQSRKFRALNVEGKIAYKPKLFDLRSLYFETMEGNLTGSAILLQKPDDHFIFKTQTLLDKINICTLFGTFNNFGQSLIEAKNIKGKISGLTNFSSEWSNSFVMLPATVLVDGAYKIENGELIEYEPLNGLSHYINVEELRHIYFSTLQNDIFIRNRTITIPQMDIRSANFDLVVSGTHDFDNNFNYKVKVLLSEALYRKAQKSKNQMDEFGIIETDGTRKISLPLTVKGNIDNYKISYDPKQAANNMIQNLKDEKKQLKTLLNHEFGLFKKDSANILTKEEKKKNNFLIEWENENYQSGKRAETKAKSKLSNQKETKASKDSSKIKIEFQ
jgi:hypothetical protein